MKNKNSLGTGIGFVLILIWCLLPVAWIISLSFKSTAETGVGSPQFLPKDPTLENYREILANGDFLDALRNSFGVAIIATLLSVIFATLGIMVLYGVSFLMSLFGASISFTNSPSLLGIGFSVLVCGIASLNLALDFDRIERGVQGNMPKDYEWVAALGLLVTLVWLYLEMLRLLSKLRN